VFLRDDGGVRFDVSVDASGGGGGEGAALVR